MKTFRTKITIICLAALLALLCGCSAVFGSTALSSEKAAEAMRGALAAWDAMDRRALDIHIETTASSFVKETRDIRVHCENLRSDDTRAAVQETFSCGSASYSSDEVYVDGIAYSSMDGVLFAGAYTWEAYKARLSPAVIPPREIFQNVSGSRSGGGMQIQFGGADSAAIWELPGGCTLQSAEGTAVLTADRTIEQISYQVVCQTERGETTYSITVQVLDDAEAEIRKPEQTDMYTLLTDLESVRLLKQAQCRLLGADSVSAAATEQIDCQAGGVSRTQSTSITRSGANADFSAEITSDVRLSDYSRSGQVTSYQQIESFQTGKYTLTVDGSTVPAETTVDAATMDGYCRELLTSILPPLRAVVDAGSTGAAGNTVLELSASEDMAVTIRERASQLLYQDKDLLDSIASFFETTELSCTLELDSKTGLPVRAGYTYGCTHTIEGFSYNLLVKTECTYLFP